MASSAETEAEGRNSSDGPGGSARWTRPGSAGDRSTTRSHIADVAIDLFSARGFDAVSVDDVAQAAGIARRTLFRYYASKNAILWGDFDAHLEHLGELLDDVDPDVATAGRAALSPAGVQHLRRGGGRRHRNRMRVILETAELQAYSMTMYAGWRDVIARFVATTAAA